ncbi:MAG: alpha-2-macroglobulin family protein [Thiolinea sp.]
MRDAELGYFDYRFGLPMMRRLRRWRAEVRITAKDEAPAQTFSFQVEEFMPERMQLTLSTEKAVVFKGEKLVVAVQGDYLYGAPAAGNLLKSERNLQLDRHPLPDYKDYYFGDQADEKRLQREELSDLNLDEKGGGFLEIDPAPENVASPLKIRVVSSLSEAGGRVVTRSLEESYWPAQHLVGIAPEFADDVVAADSEARFAVVRVNAKGERQPGENLAATLVREDYDYFWEYSEEDGWVRQENRSEYPVKQQTLTLAAGDTGQLVFPVGSGRYRLEIEDADTGLKTVYGFYAGWAGEQARSNRPDQIELQLDKPAYKAGETIQLAIKPTAAAEAVVAVEGDELLWSKTVSLSAAGTTVDIPVADDWARHDLYISVTAFRPASSEKRIMPNRALGLIHLPLDRSERKLDLSITAPEKVIPEKPVTVLVQAANLKGGRAILSLAAVDSGVLNITRFKTPDPWSYYFGRHEYGADLHDDYGKIIESVEAQAMHQRFGGGNSGSAGGPRAQPVVQIVSLFKGPVAFDAEGKAEVELFIPGFDGQLRLMAVAMSEEQMGSAERDMIVASPVVASMAGPRFLAVGDTSFLTLELNNTTEQQQTVTLDVMANKLLNLEEVKRDLVLAAGQKEVIRLPVSARGHFGVGSVRLKLTGTDFEANRNLDMAVRPAYPAQRKTHYFEVTPGKDITLSGKLAAGLLPETVQAQLTVSNTPVLPVASALQGLLRYPYGCLEQTASSAYPYLFLCWAETEKWGLPPPTMEARNEQVQAALVRLAGMQLSSGAFTLWGSYGNTEYWLSAYVADFLLDAKRQGFKVPDYLWQQSLSYLSDHVQEGYRRPVSRYGFSDHPAHLDVAARAYAAYVLARENKAQLGTLRTILRDDAPKAVTGLPWVHLGLALILQGDRTQGQEAINKGLSMVRDEEMYLGDYGSAIRDKAMMLYQLLINNQTVPELGKQVKALADLIHGRSYLSTQEQVFVFLLGRQLEKQATQRWQAQLLLNQQTMDLSHSEVICRTCRQPIWSRE